MPYVISFAKGDTAYAEQVSDENHFISNFRGKVGDPLCQSAGTRPSSSRGQQVQPGIRDRGEYEVITACLVACQVLYYGYA